MESQERKRLHASAAHKHQKAYILTNPSTSCSLQENPLHRNAWSNGNDSGLRRENFSGGEFLHGHMNLTCGAELHARRAQKARQNASILQYADGKKIL